MTTRSRRSALLVVALAAIVITCAGCPGSSSDFGVDRGAGDRGLGDGGGGDGSAGGETAPGLDTGSADAVLADSSADAPLGGPAYLHVDLWSIWWNDRTRCGAERTFLEICQQRKEADCSLYSQAYSACSPQSIVYGQVGPEKSGETLCQRSKLPSVGGCEASKYDFAQLRYWWYGAEWQGNWPVATIKVFPQGADWKGGGELIALSTHPGAAQAVMSGISNHGLGWGCAMAGKTSGDAAYRTPFGAFAWIALPTDKAVTVAGMAATNFGGQPFAGCGRGNASQSPWVTSPPGAQLGCVYVEQSITFKPGRHYLWRYGKISELPSAGPPQDIIDAFKRAEIGLDVTTRAACKL
ncbi:MAG: hypothetical protein KC503_02585 [Myxococcales bacterium]|nr:hypothetical protein [Myxococcales bacterium]